MKRIINILKTIITLFALYLVYKIIDFEELFNVYNQINHKYLYILILIPLILLIVLQFYKILKIYQLFDIKNLISKDIIEIQSKVNLFAEISSILMISSRAIFDMEKNIPIKKSIFISIVDKSFSVFSKLLFIIPGLIYLLELSLNFYFIVYFIVILIFLYLIVYFLIKKYHIKLDKKKLIQIFIFSILMQILIFFSLSCIFILSVHDVFIWKFLLLIPIAITIQEMPISISSFGFRELVFIYIFNLISLTPALSLIISLSYGVLRFISVFLVFLIIKLKVIKL